MTREEDLGRIDRAARNRRELAATRWLLFTGWLLAAVGYYGSWIGHGTAALTLSGIDMGEFVKFLPGVLEGSLTIVRQLFYLPALAVVVSVALLVGSRRLGYPWPLKLVILLAAIPVSLQLLPPAWSPASLMTAEFRAQTIALGLSWLLLATFWFWGRLPGWLTGSLGGLFCAAALGLSAWQYTRAKPAIDEVYGTAPSVGWGFALCMFGLAIVVAGCCMLVLRSRARVWSGEVWSSE